ncbi:uncharacterized protein [Rutidosis leptorrhynchoides]|uniref:uncharacterized protein n=1 Tax=Rutidosis leptorrhynchoides TaxID=125765 RepID=UPI003A992E85
MNGIDHITKNTISQKADTGGSGASSSRRPAPAPEPEPEMQHEQEQQQEPQQQPDQHIPYYDPVQFVNEFIVFPMRPPVEFPTIPEHTLHPNLRFDRRWRDYETYQRNKFKLVKKNVEVPRVIDWAPLETVHLADRVRQLLVQRYGSSSFTDWERLFTIRRPVYKEWCVELMSTVSLDTNIVRIDDRRFLRFILGGRMYRMSMLDMARVLKPDTNSSNSSWVLKVITRGLRFVTERIKQKYSDIERDDSKSGVWWFKWRMKVVELMRVVDNLRRGEGIREIENERDDGNSGCGFGINRNKRGSDGDHMGLGFDYATASKLRWGDGSVNVNRVFDWC